MLTVLWLGRGAGCLLSGRALCAGGIGKREEGGVSLLCTSPPLLTQAGELSRSLPFISFIYFPIQSYIEREWPVCWFAPR